MGGGDLEIARRRDDRSPRPPGSQPARLALGPGPPARTDPRLWPPSRTGTVLQRPVDQGWRQHRHGPGNLAGARRALRHAAVGPVLAPGHRRRQLGCERRHPPAWTVRAARIPPLPGSVPAVADQPSVPSVLEPAGGPPPRADAADHLSVAAGTRGRAWRANIGGVSLSDQRGIVRGCCLGLLVLLIAIG